MHLHAGLDFRNRNMMGGEDVEHDGREERHAQQKQEMTEDFKRRLNFEYDIWLQALKLGCKQRLIT